ncbi:MAG: DinB family protein [bacterium]|nr:DinB family protein [bacterium]
MSEVERQIELMKLTFDGDETGEARFGTALMHLLKDVDSKRANHRPLPDAHTIWEIVLHIIAWKRYTATRLRDQRSDMNEDIDWPKPAETSEAAWQKTVQELRDIQAELVSASNALRDDQLDSPVAGGKVLRYLVLQGIMQHDIYHAGQIGLLKKAAL